MRLNCVTDMDTFTYLLRDIHREVTEISPLKKYHKSIKLKEISTHKTELGDGRGLSSTHLLQDVHKKVAEIFPFKKYIRSWKGKKKKKIKWKKSAPQIELCDGNGHSCTHLLRDTHREVTEIYPLKKMSKVEKVGKKKRDLKIKLCGGKGHTLSCTYFTRCTLTK